MSLADIEGALGTLNPEELRQLALKSWRAFLEREHGDPTTNECSEDDPDVLAALDEAIRIANANPGRGASADEVRDRLREWTSR